MFGKRYDGFLVKDIDPIVSLTPYLMPMRCDAQVMLTYKADYEKLARYIIEKGAQGYKITFMDIILAAYVRSLSQMPEINRFIANKRTYARKEAAVSFAVLKNTSDGSVQENTAKCKFDPRDTIFEVSARIKAAVDICREEEADNSTMKIAQFLKMPLLANLIVGLARILDRYGLLPKFIIEASPFHTSMFFTNNASIGLPAVLHHIYNFGTTSQFVSIGNIERITTVDSQGKPLRKNYLPIGVTADERICAGMVYSKFLSHFFQCISNPEIMEKPPEKVFFDENHEYSLPQVKKKKIKVSMKNILRGKKDKDSVA